MQNEIIIDNKKQRKSVREKKRSGFSEFEKKGELG